MENEKQQNKTPPSETSLAPERPIKKPKLKWLIPFIVVVDVVILGIAVWAGYNYWLKPVVPEEQLTQEQQSEEKDEFADWKTYRNESLGIEFKYPSNARFNDFKPFYTDTNKSGIRDVAHIFLDESNINITISNLEEFIETTGSNAYNRLLNLNENFEEFQEDRSNGNKCDFEFCYYHRLKTKIDGVPALDEPHSQPGGVGRAISMLKDNRVIDIYHNKPYLYIEFFKDNPQLSISSEEDKNKDPEYKIFENFLSNFKFIN